MNNRTVLVGNPLQKEAVASSSISPGMLIAFGGSNDVEPHDTEGGVASPMFAREPDLIGGGQDHTYAADDTVLYVVARPGDEIRAILKSGENASAKGTSLSSAGDGKLQVTEAGQNVVAIAKEVVNASGGDAYITIEVCSGYRSAA